MPDIEREKLDELELIIRDLRMTIDIKEQVENGADRGLITYADGTKISMPIPDEVKDQLNSKITQLSTILKEKVAKLP